MAVDSKTPIKNLVHKAINTGDLVAMDKILKRAIVECDVDICKKLLDDEGMADDHPAELAEYQKMNSMAYIEEQMKAVVEKLKADPGDALLVVKLQNLEKQGKNLGCDDDIC